MQVWNKGTRSLESSGITFVTVCDISYIACLMFITVRVLKIDVELMRPLIRLIGFATMNSMPCIIRTLNTD